LGFELCLVGLGRFGNIDFRRVSGLINCGVFLGNYEILIMKLIQNPGNLAHRKTPLHNIFCFTAMFHHFKSKSTPQLKRSFIICFNMLLFSQGVLIVKIRDSINSINQKSHTSLPNIT
jgi:hypothetical protein